MFLRQLIVFLSVTIVASIGYTPGATAKYRVTVPLTDSVLEAVPTEPPVVLAKGGKRPQAQFKQAAKKPTKRTKPTATLNKPIAGQRRPSVSQRVKDVQFSRQNISVSGFASNRHPISKIQNPAAFSGKRKEHSDSRKRSEISQKLNNSKLSTASRGQSSKPRNLNEKLLYQHITNDPRRGKPLPGLNNDPRFKKSDGWQKMQMTFKTIRDKSITTSGKSTTTTTIAAHYQYNWKTKEISDVQFVK